MKLDFFNKITNHTKTDNDISNFVDELKEFLNHSNKENTIDEEILKKMQTERNTSLISKNKMYQKKDEIIMKYANQNMEALYFVANKSKTEDVYRIEKYENGEKENLQIHKKDLPENISVNAIMKQENDQYIIDKILTQEINDYIEKSAKEILDEQDKKLNEYKQEGHLYSITENRNNRIYIWDLTTKPNIEIEEVNFPEELRNKVSEGTILQYRNGQYKIKE